MTFYYVSMTLFASVQALCVFGLLPHLTPLSATGFTLGVLLCVGSAAVMTSMRSKRTGGGGGSPRARIGAGGNVDRSSLIDNGQVYAVDEPPAGGSRAADGGAADAEAPVLAVPPNMRLEPLPATAPHAAESPPQPRAQRHTVG